MKILGRWFSIVICVLYLGNISATPFVPANNKTVLVTGGVGYIGSQTCKALKEAGYKCVAYDNLSTGTEKRAKWGPLVVGDLLDVEQLEKAFIEYKPSAVIHFAGLKSVGESIQNPSEYYSTNVVGTMNLLHMMMKYDVKSIVFSSSAAVYGNEDRPLLDEGCQCNPISPYATTKWIGEKMIAEFAHAYGLNYINFRYFNASGVDPETIVYRDLTTLHHVIPNSIKTLLLNKGPFQVFGNDYSTPDGSGVRDYIHVIDLADAHVLGLNYLMDGGKSDTINLGTGKGYSVFDVLNVLEEVSKKPVPRVINPKREGDIAQAVADNRKAKELLHFEPKHSSLKEIIESEWSSFLE